MFVNSEAKKGILQCICVFVDSEERMRKFRNYNSCTILICDAGMFVYRHLFKCAGNVHDVLQMCRTFSYRRMQQNQTNMAGMVLSVLTILNAVSCIFVGNSLMHQTHMVKVTTYFSLLKVFVTTLT